MLGYIWSNRNKANVNDTPKGWIETIEDTSNYIVEFKYYNRASVVLSNTIQQRLVRWQPPMGGDLKLNVDTTCAKESGRGFEGGVVRDKDGVIWGAFGKVLEKVPSVLAAECAAIREDLIFVKERGWRNMTILESGCSKAVEDCLNKTFLSPHDSIIFDIVIL